jgi:hypothetical protein
VLRLAVENRLLYTLPNELLELASLLCSWKASRFLVLHGHFVRALLPGEAGGDDELLRCTGEVLKVSDTR